MWKNFLLFVVLAGTLAWACSPGFTDTLNIKVVDSQYRPISGAAVNITYQKDVTTGKGYVTSTTQYTGEDGRVSITARNAEVFENRVACDITISAEYDGARIDREIEAESHSAELQMRFTNAHLLSFRVVDMQGYPIGNTRVRINDMYRNTTEDGYVAIIVNGGTVELAVPYLSAIVTREVEVSSDLTYTLQARAYALRVNVIDDRGEPLVAQITVEEEEFVDTGVEIEGLAITRPYVRVAYGIVEKFPEIDLTQGGDYTVSFDLTPPEITNVKVERKGEELKIGFYLEDANPYSSGADIDSTTVTYIVSGVTQTAVPYADGGAYAVELPAPPENTLLRFTITAYDEEGNMNTLNGEYFVTPESEEEPEEAGGEEGPLLSEEGGIVLLGLGAIVILVLAYVVISYFRGLSEEE